MNFKGGVRLSLISVTAFLLVVGTRATAEEPDFEAIIEAQTRLHERDLLAHQQLPDTAPGSVMAAPSQLIPYSFDWVRDTGKRMSTLVDLYQSEQNPAFKKFLFDQLADYVSATRRIQGSPTLSGEAYGAGLGEPKFNPDHSPYSGQWGRPQNGGVCFRVQALIHWLSVLLSERQNPKFSHLHSKIDFIIPRLYSPTITDRSAIKVDLEFIAHLIEDNAQRRNWWENNVEAWEETRGLHFSDLNMHLESLRLGSEIAQRFNDPAAAHYYKVQSEKIPEQLEKFWDPHKGYITQTRNWVEGPRKESNLDALVVMSSLDKSFGPFHFEDPRVLLTAKALIERMRALYPINAKKFDDHNRPLAPAIGRYAEDTYDGMRSGSEGNPWFLITAYFAQFFHRNGLAFATSQQPKEVSLELIDTMKILIDTNFAPERLDARDPRRKQLAEDLLRIGDMFLARYHFHAGGVAETSEQFNRHTGRPQGAKRLTWNCAAYLQTIQIRTQLKESIAKF